VAEASALWWCVDYMPLPSLWPARKTPAAAGSCPQCEGGGDTEGTETRKLRRHAASVDTSRRHVDMQQSGMRVRGLCELAECERLQCECLEGRCCRSPLFLAVQMAIAAARGGPKDRREAPAEAARSAA